MPHLPIAEIFNNCLYRIPDYQRGYSWERQHLEEFWQDLSYVNLKEPGAIYKHFYGTITLDQLTEEALTDHEGVRNDVAWLCNPDMGYKGYFIVDGQQRLTTIMILIKVLVDWANKNNQTHIGENSVELIRNQYLFRLRPIDGTQHYIFGYEADDPSYRYWCEYIMGDLDVADKAVVHTVYTRRLKDAYEFFYERVDRDYRASNCAADEYAFTKLSCLLSHVRHGLLVNIDILTSEFNVGIAFETMNNRGKKLSLLELLKNRLIYLSTSIDDRPLRARINTVWRKIYQYLGKNEKLSLKDDDFLKTHYIVYFGYDPDADQYYNGLINNHFSPSRLSLEKKDQLRDRIQKYVNSVDLGIELWYEYKSCELNPNRLGGEDLCFRFQNLTYIGYGNFESLTLAALMYARACNHPYSEQTTRELVEFFDALERFRFIAFYVVPSKKSHFKRADGYSLAHDLYLREQNLSGAALFVQNWLKHINAPSVKFQDMVSEMFEGTDSKGFFSWDGLGYLLYRYETSLRGDAAKLVQLDDVSTETIEHILPQTIDGRAYWHDQFRGYDDRRHYFTHALGNLAVCSGRANSLYGNRPYYDENPKECKRELYKQGSFTLRKISHEHEEWGPEQIIQRTKELLEFMFKTWDIGILPSVNMNWLLYAKWFGLDRIGNNGGFE